MCRLSVAGDPLILGGDENADADAPMVFRVARDRRPPISRRMSGTGWVRAGHHIAVGAHGAESRLAINGAHADHAGRLRAAGAAVPATDPARATSEQQPTRRGTRPGSAPTRPPRRRR